MSKIMFAWVLTKFENALKPRHTGTVSDRVVDRVQSLKESKFYLNESQHASRSEKHNEKS